MFPKWFTEWSEKNPTNIFGPGIIVGVVGSAVFVAAFIVAWGQPFATASTQTGPRGTGMSVPEFVSDLAKGDPTIEGFTTSSPIVPAAGATLAKDGVENAEPLLGDLTVENYDRLVTAMREWTGIEDLFAGEENYQTVVARRMIQMTQALNEEWDGHTNSEVGVTCYTCHRGEVVPSTIWFDNASLPSDALQKLLVDGEQITVHDLESRVAGSPSDEDFRSIQDTERTYALMNYFAGSLGVNCVFCHNSRAFYDTAEVTPQWATASLGIGMVQEINNDYLIDLAEIYPDERLGAKGDAPKAACATCHKGYQKPLQGLNVIADWPELATSETPEYE